MHKLIHIIVTDVTKCYFFKINFIMLFLISQLHTHGFKELSGLNIERYFCSFYF